METDSNFARILAIGDIHGCVAAFDTLLESVEFSTDDLLITLGDYVDRGPCTCDVLDRLIAIDQSHSLIPLRGNHDIMMANALLDEASFDSWIGYGGEETLRSYGISTVNRPAMKQIPEAHWTFLSSRLQPYYETNSHLFVHATISPDLSLEAQSDFALYWKKLEVPIEHNSGKVLVCGHTSQKNGRPLIFEKVICIDTWACGSGWLTCLDVESGALWQANQAGHTRKL